MLHYLWLKKFYRKYQRIYTRNNFLFAHSFTSRTFKRVIMSLSHVWGIYLLMNGKNWKESNTIKYNIEITKCCLDLEYLTYKWVILYDYLYILCTRQWWALIEKYICEYYVSIIRNSYNYFGYFLTCY